MVFFVITILFSPLFWFDVQKKFISNQIQEIFNRRTLDATPETHKKNPKQIKIEKHSEKLEG